MPKVELALSFLEIMEDIFIRRLPKKKPVPLIISHLNCQKILDIFRIKSISLEFDSFSSRFQCQDIFRRFVFFQKKQLAKKFECLFLNMELQLSTAEEKKVLNIEKIYFHADDF